MTLEIVIKLDNIVKSYRLYKGRKDRLKEALHPAGKKYHQDFHALRNVNLEVKRGEILGIMGKNGAGKSTLLQIISDVLTPTSGTKWTKGTVIPLLDLGAGFNPEFTGLQNIYFKAALQGLKKQEIDKRLDAILAFADIGDFVYQPVNVYSSGMKARLGFAVSVNIDPEILVVDEVLAVGDEFFKRKCYLKMQQLMQSGCTVIYVSHSRNAIVQLCTRAILLDDGELIMDNAPLAVTRQYERLLYAAPENYPAVRRDIAGLEKRQETARDFFADESGQTGADGSAGDFMDDEAELDRNPLFLEDFTSRTAVSRRVLDVDIFDARMETESGDSVNVLTMRETFIFSWRVRFNASLEQVQFATTFQNKKGIALSGMMLPGRNTQQTIRVGSGETYLIKNEFKCLLRPGTYYVTATVFHVDPDKGRVPVSETADLFMFKIAEDGNEPVMGIVDLGQTGGIIKLADE
jgi:lipopolysaccharide transport system ATP-binding protein